ncbi:hypothetical protein M231_07955 [Tremella mesenterica]|uniref:Uncharacterized protein n=1 Tax=Tremella mesenterica TaxID=5217 RepID=A0A4Q1B7X0_TREME|nr:hypothetical protein M231_07955 [Tremella mesenterica]
MVQMRQGQTWLWWRVFPDGREQWEDQDPSVIAKGLQIIALDPLEAEEAGENLTEDSLAVTSNE